MQRFLLITLAAPLASFGELAGHEVRDGWERPGKSALLGLLGAALGVRRDDAEGQKALAETVVTGVRVDSPGIPLQDFHTAQYVPTARIRKLKPRTRAQALAALDPKRDNPEITRREYRQDTLYTAAYARTPDCPWRLEDMQAAFLSPRFVLFLGRKSCPLSLPLVPRIVRAQDMLEALQQAHASLTEQQRRFMQKASVRDAGTPYAAIPADMTTRRNMPGRLELRVDHPLDRRRWHFAARHELRIPLQEEAEP